MKRVVGVFLLCWVLSSNADGEPGPVSQDLALAARLFDDGRYELVLGALEPLLEADLRPEQASKALYLRAESFYQLEQWNEARESFSELRREYPKARWNEHALPRLVSLFLREDKIEDASVAVEELSDRFPESANLPDAMLAVGLGVLRAGEFERAQEILSRWMERFDGSTSTVDARLGLARTSLALGRYEDTAGQCRAVIESGTPPEAMSAASSILVQSLSLGGELGTLAAEGESLLKNIANEAEAARCGVPYAIALVRTGETVGGMERLQNLLGGPLASSLDGELLVDANVALAGAILAASPEPEKKRVYSLYDTALALIRAGSAEGRLGTVLNRKGLAAWSLADRETAVGCFEAATAAAEDDSLVSAALNLGRSVAALGDCGRAAKAYDGILSRDPRPPGWEWAALGKAECAYEQADWAECRSALAEVPPSTGAFSAQPKDLIDERSAAEIVRRAAYIRGSAALSLGDLGGAGAAFGELLQITAERSRDRSLALVGLGEVARRNGNPGRAALLYEQALGNEGIAVPPTADTRVAPSSGDIVEPALFGLARARQEAGQGEASLILFEAFSALFPDGPYIVEAGFRQAELLEGQNRPEEAKEAYAVLSEREPASEFTLEAAHRAALIDANLGRTQEAEQRLRELLDALAHGAGADVAGGTAAFEEAVRYDLGDLYLTRGGNTDAAAEFARNLERFPLGPGRDRNLSALARARYNNGDFGEAAKTYEELLDLKGTSPLAPDALLWLGWSYENLGEREQARAAWSRLEGEFPKSDSAPLAAAALAQQVESASAAAAAGLWARLAEVYQGSPLAGPSLFRAGMLALEAIEPATAVRCFHRYRERFPDADRVTESLVWEGQAHQLAEAHAEARDAFETYLEQSEVGIRDRVLWASAITGIGRSMRAIGDPHGGAAFLEGELAKPGTQSDVFRDAWVLLGDLLFEIGRPAQALPAYRRVMAMARGDRLEAQVTLRSAECLEAMDRLDEAAMEYIRAAYLYESVTDLATVGMIRAADLFERLGNYREAIRTYRRALELTPAEEEETRIEKRVAWLEEHLGLLELELREKK